MVYRDVCSVACFAFLTKQIQRNSSIERLRYKKTNQPTEGNNESDSGKLRWPRGTIDGT